MKTGNTFLRKCHCVIPALFALALISGCSSSDDDAAVTPTDGGMMDTGGTTDAQGGTDGVDGTDGDGCTDAVGGTDGDGGTDAVGGTDDGDDDAVQECINDDGTSTFKLELTAEQATPPLDIPDALGEAELVIDKTSGAISGTVQLSGLTGTSTEAHIHRGFAGIAGPPIITLEGNPQPEDVGAPDDPNSLRVPLGSGLDSDALAALDNGELYINIHTENNPDGEVRGQIIPIGVILEDSELSIEEVVEPEFASEATGLGFSTVNETSGAISATVFLSQLDDATAVEIRSGAVGSNGELVLMMEQDSSDVSVWRTPAASMLNEAQIEAYKGEALYFNATSTRAPLGEIRGQL